MLNSRNDAERTPLHVASLYDYDQIVREIVAIDRNRLNDQDEHSRTPLHLAAFQGNVKTVTELIRLGASTADV